MKRTTELLAPASSLNSVIAAVNSGCDSIYIGGKLFSARAYADSPDEKGLEEIIDLCHLRGVKVFITLNTLYKNSELDELMRFARYLYNIGADAFIVQDIGFLTAAKKTFPDIELHCSTQMTIHNTPASVMFDKLGYDRIVLSRELSLDEIKDISANVSCDIECFVHGALCVCYSGRCLMSSIFGGRSGNRGRCAQPCRMEYTLYKNGEKQQSGTLLSPKDICTVEMTDSLINAGIYSFKIEGRMKSPEYVAQVVSTYRKAIDGGRLSHDDTTDLLQIFNRGGSFSNGYYNCYAGNKMIAPSQKSSGVKAGTVIAADKKGCTVKLAIPLHCGDGVEIWNRKKANTGCGISSEYASGSTVRLKIYGEKGCPVYRSYDKQLADRLKKTYTKLTRQTEIPILFTARKDEPMKLTMMFDKPIGICGDVPQKAESKPTTKDEMISRLKKTGETPFIFDIKAEIDNDLFIPASALNRLRREACEAAETAIIEGSKRNGELPVLSIGKNDLTRPQKLTVFTENIGFVPDIIKFAPHRIYIEANEKNSDLIIEYTKQAHACGIEIFAALPRIARNEYIKRFEPVIEKLEKSDIDGYLVRNFNSIKTEKKLMHDYCFNVMNSLSAELFENVTLSPELNAKEMKDISGNGREIVVYGHLVLMSTHQCPVGNSTGRKNGKFCSECGNKDKYFLKDRTGAMLPILTHCQSCTAFILNSLPIYTANKWKEISAVNAEFMRLDFTVESREQMISVLESCTAAFKSSKNAIPPEFAYTGGHFFRGVQ